MQNFESQTKNFRLDPVRTSLLNTELVAGGIRVGVTKTFFLGIFRKSRVNIYEASTVNPDPFLEMGTTYYF